MKHVALPNGEVVEVSTEPEAWWTQHGATGYVSPALLYPDPNQQRKAIGEGSDWDDFKTGIRTSGVREYIRVTPFSAAPWIRKLAGSTCQFVIISGHRRHKAATEEELVGVPIVIHIYGSEEEYRNDSDLLNIGRKDITPLEEAFEINRRRELNHPWETIAAARGMSIATCRARVRLLNLAPDIQVLIDPVARSGKRSDFPINVAQALGTIIDVVPGNFLEMLGRFGFTKEDVTLVQTENEYMLSFALQRALLARINTLAMNSLEALEFIAHGKVRTNASDGTGTHSYHNSGRKPAQLRKVLEAGIRVIQGSKTLTKDLIRTACSDQEIPYLEGLIKECDVSLAEANRVKAVLQAMLDGRRQALEVRPREAFTVTPVRGMNEIDPAALADIAARYGAVKPVKKE